MAAEMRITLGTSIELEVLLGRQNSFCMRSATTQSLKTVIF